MTKVRIKSAEECMKLIQDSPYEYCVSTRMVDIFADTIAEHYGYVNGGGRSILRHSEDYSPMNIDLSWDNVFFDEYLETIDNRIVGAA